MNDKHPIESLEVVINMAKHWREAGNKLVRVRRIDESDMKTLERVIDDYAKMVGILYAHVSEKDRSRLNDQWKGSAPEVLQQALERAKVFP